MMVDATMWARVRVCDPTRVCHYRQRFEHDVGRIHVRFTVSTICHEMQCDARAYNAQMNIITNGSLLGLIQFVANPFQACVVVTLQS